MSDLKAMIKNKLEDDRGLALKIAQLAGFKNATPLYKFLNEADREMENFNSLIVIVRELFEDRVTELMSDYILTLDPNKKAARYALEYTSVNGLKELKSHLINKLINKNANNESNEWAKIYAEEEKVENNVNSSTIQELGCIKLNKPETQVFRTMLQVYAAFNLEMFDYTFELASMMKNQLNDVKDPFIKASYQARLGLILCGANVYHGDIETARKEGWAIVNGEIRIERIDTLIYLNLGNSYIFENYDKSYQYLKLSLDMATRTSLNMVNEAKKSINFLENVWNKEVQYLDHDSQEIEDIQEVIHKLVNEGKLNEAQDKLNLLMSLPNNDYQMAFTKYLEWRVTNNKAAIIASVKLFKKSGDKFFIKLALIELRKLGYEEEMIELISM